MKTRIMAEIGFLSVALFFSASAMCLGGKDFRRYSSCSYEEFGGMKDLVDREGTKIRFEMSYSSIQDASQMVNQASGWGFIERIDRDGQSDLLDYKPAWVKEAWPREKNLVIIDASIPIVINGKKSLVERVKGFDRDAKFTVFGVVKKKILKYHVKRTFYYIDVESIQDNSREMASVSQKAVKTY